MATAKLDYNDLTYDKALSNLGGKAERKIGHNTWLVKRDDGVAVKYHYTDIVTFHPDYSITVRTGGWDTSTTRGRLNQILRDHRAYSEKGCGIIEDASGVAYYLNSVVEINSNGEITNDAPIFASALGAFLGKEIPTVAALVETIKGLSLEQTEAVWKKFKKERGMIARNCPEIFLPLALGSSKGEEFWRSIVTERLRETKEAA